MSIITKFECELRVCLRSMCGKVDTKKKETPLLNLS